MTIIIFPILIMIIGALLYFFASNAKWQEIGRIMFFCGLFIAMLGVPQKGIGVISIQ
jgi:Na+/phosphate symporter